MSLSRNLGLILGASVMGAAFAFGVGTDNFAQASSAAIAGGMRLTFLLAAAMMLLAIGVAFGGSFGRVFRSRDRVRPLRDVASEKIRTSSLRIHRSTL